MQVLSELLHLSLSREGVMDHSDFIYWSAGFCSSLDLFVYGYEQKLILSL